MSCPRRLTPVEIHTLLGTVLTHHPVVGQLTDAMRAAFTRAFFDQYTRELEQVEVYPEAIPRLQELLIRKFQPVSPAKSVGIVCGQSIGEMQTQTTLNTFHKCGLTEKLVVAGVPRFLEIIDTNRSETQGTPSAYVHFTAPIPQTITEARARVGHSLMAFTFQQLVNQYRVCLAGEEPLPVWYPEGVVPEGVRIEYTLHLGLLHRYRIPLTHVRDQLLRSSSGGDTSAIVASPLCLGRIDVWSTRHGAIEAEDQLHVQLGQVSICGVDRIQNVFFMRLENDRGWYVETDGSNLEELMHLPFVDTYRTYTNDIWEIYNLFGIEAVRAYIVEELTALMPTIHPTHIALLADRMTVSGRLRSISRYTRKHEQSSVLSKATFEETLSGFLRSALMNETDTVNGSSASIICGKVPRVGTGMNDLVL